MRARQRFMSLAQSTPLYFERERGLNFRRFPDVLGVRGDAEVDLAIVEAVVVDVIAKHAGRDVDDQVVHLEVFAFFLFAVGERVDGVPGVATPVGVPFELSQPGVVFRIDEGELAPGQRDAAEWIAVAHPAVPEL
ncbi:MAG: hypothetical protein A2Z25_00355 [Planctomycetes bacterium RBG_16_55_9]|nr:MAG: hypothetical protein A2Z25_00355 [Planctomycetes bacterium RBG_16_55_9]